MTNKMTLKEKFATIKNFLNGEDVTSMTIDEMIAFCDERIALIDAKTTSSKSKKADAHKEYDAMVFAIMETETEPKTVSELMTSHEELSMAKGNSISGVTHALKRLADKGLVVNVKEGGKSYYKVV